MSWSTEQETVKRIKSLYTPAEGVPNIQKTSSERYDEETLFTLQKKKCLQFLTIPISFETS